MADLIEDRDGILHDTPQRCAFCGRPLVLPTPCVCPQGVDAAGRGIVPFQHKTDAAREEARRIVEAWENLHGTHHTCDTHCRGGDLIDAIAAALGERDRQVADADEHMAQVHLADYEALADLRERIAAMILAVPADDAMFMGRSLIAHAIRQIPLRRGDPRG